MSSSLPIHRVEPGPGPASVDTGFGSHNDNYSSNSKLPAILRNNRLGASSVRPVATAPGTALPRGRHKRQPSTAEPRLVVTNGLARPLRHKRSRLLAVKDSVSGDHSTAESAYIASLSLSSLKDGGVKLEPAPLGPSDPTSASSSQRPGNSSSPTSPSFLVSSKRGGKAVGTPLKEGPGLSFASIFSASAASYPPEGGGTSLTPTLANFGLSSPRLQVPSTSLTPKLAKVGFSSPGLQLPFAVPPREDDVTSARTSGSALGNSQFVHLNDRATASPSFLTQVPSGTAKTKTSISNQPDERRLPLLTFSFKGKAVARVPSFDPEPAPPSPSKLIFSRSFKEASAKINNTYAHRAPSDAGSSLPAQIPSRLIYNPWLKVKSKEKLPSIRSCLRCPLSDNSLTLPPLSPHAFTFEEAQKLPPLRSPPPTTPRNLRFSATFTAGSCRSEVALPLTLESSDAEARDRDSPEVSDESPTRTSSTLGESLNVDTFAQEPDLPVRSVRGLDGRAQFIACSAPFEPNVGLGQIQSREPLPSLGTLVPFIQTPPNEEQPIDFMRTLCAVDDVILQVASHLDPDSIVNAYAISKDLHRVMNRNLTSVIVAIARRYAPESSKIFPWRMYPHLCIHDPVSRQHPTVSGAPRLNPSFRFLRFLCFREYVTAEILTLLALEGHRVPKWTSKTIKKVWFLLDISTNSARTAAVHTEKLFTNWDLMCALMFFFKLDMRFCDPVDGNGETALRRLLLAQRSLVPLWRTLRREELCDEVDLMRLFARALYQPTPDSVSGEPVFGIPWDEVGVDGREGWDRGGKKLLRPDELILRECVRRQIPIQRLLLDAILYGWVDYRTWKNVPIPTAQKVCASSGPYPEEDEDEDEEDGEVKMIEGPPSSMELKEPFIRIPSSDRETTYL